MADPVQRRLAAILAADVVGYSRMMGADEEGTRSRFNAHLQELIEPSIAGRRGRIVKTIGDGLLVEFASAVDAVQCAVEIQKGMAERNAARADDQRMDFRIGVNLGDVIIEGDDIHGDGVNVAARLEEVAEPGGIYLSDLVRASTRNKLDFAIDDLGEQSLKNIAEPVRVYRVSLEGKSDTAAASDALFRRPAVAVLPFENLSGDPEQEYFADGLTEDICTVLSLWRSFPVIARNSTFAYKQKLGDIRAVGKELGARYVVEGSVRKAGNRVRVTAQLINSETGHQLWAERFDRDYENIFDLQDEITQRIVGTIAPELERLEQTLSQSKVPTSLTAWEHVHRGMGWLEERTKEGNARSREAFEHAIELDPKYSRAFSGLSRSYHRDLQIGAGLSHDEMLQKALETGRRAVALDQTDSLAHTMLGIALAWAGDNDEAIAEYEYAIDLNSSEFTAHIGLGLALSMDGRHEDGISHLKKGLQINPRDPRNHLYFGFLARAYLTAKRYFEAAEWAQKAIRWRPENHESHLLLAACLGHLGQIDEAWAELEECERIHAGYTSSPERWLPYKHEADSEHFLDGLRKAGWKG